MQQEVIDTERGRALVSGAVAPTQQPTGGAEHDTLLRQAVEGMTAMRGLLKLVSRQGRAEGDQEHLAKVGEGQFHALHCLYEEGRMTPGELAERCRVADPTISKILKSLEHGGLVERHTDPENRRIVRVTLTPDGRAMHDRFQQHFVTGLAQVLQPLSSMQLTDLITAFRHLDALVKATGQDSDTVNDTI